PWELISRMSKTIHIEVISRAVDHLVGAQRAASVPAEIGTLAAVGQAIAIFPNCKWLPSLERDEAINLPAAHQSVHNPAHRVTESLPAPTLFLFLCEHALSEPGVVIHEQEVGI